MRSKNRNILVVLAAVFALSGLTAASALASGKPTVETKPASPVGGAYATLNGTVNPNGETGNSYYFEYGTTTSYGSSTPKGILASGSEAVKVSKVIEGLAVNTTYHFRVVATNKSGTTDGADEVFTTTSTEKPEFAIKAGEKLTEARYSGTFHQAYWEVPNESTFGCGDEKGLIEGQVLGTKTVTGKIAFTNCKANGEACASEGAKEGEIATVELEGKLVYISKASKSVGIDFKPKAGTVLSKFTCLYRGEVTGSIIVPLTGPLNKLTREFGVAPLRQSRGVQEISQYENGAGLKVNSSLSTTWPSGTSVSLGWGLESGFPLSINKQIEIQA
jgi:hypothetical protein